ISISVEVTQVNTDESLDLKLALYCVESPFMPGLTHESMRQTLLARIDRIIRDFEHTDKRPGNRAPFEVKIIRKGLKSTFAGIDEASRLITRLIDVLERGA